MIDFDRTPDLQRLSPREREILSLIATQALSFKQVADALGISKKTVEAHTFNFKHKLKAKNIMAAVLIAHGVEGQA